MALLKPTLEQFGDTLDQLVKTIAPMERVQVLVPREYSHHDEIHLDTDSVDQPLAILSPEHYGENLRNWNYIEELQMNYRGSALPPNLFMTLRFSQEDEGEIIMDFFRLS